MGSDVSLYEQVIHQDRTELGLQVQQAYLFVGIAAKPVVVGLGNGTVQEA